MNIRVRLSLLTFALAAPLAACSGSADGDDGKAPGNGDGTNAYTQQYGCATPETGFAGDSTCMKAPATEEGFQLHYGPTNYADQADVNRFVLEPGGELTDCMYFVTPNTGEVFYEEYHVRARPGTHHIIVYAGPSAGGANGTLGECAFGLGMRFMVGAQAGLGSDGVVFDVPLANGRRAVENKGHGFRIPPNTAVAFQMHYVNTSRDKPLLREGWVNFHYTPAEKVQTIVDPIWFIGGVTTTVPPRTNLTMNSKNCKIPDDGPDELRIMGVSAHMHSLATGFHAYKIAADGTKTLFYQTHNWEEPLRAQFDTVHDYDAPNFEAKNEGALSGVVTIKKGETIEYDCEYENTTDAPLTFGEQAFTGQMCNLFGFYAPGWGAPWDCYNP